MRAAALCAALAVAYPAVAAPVEIAGVSLPRYLQTPRGMLVAASCGVRDTLWFEHYVAVLYLPSGGTARAVQDPRSPKAVLFEVVDDRYLPDRIPEKWRGPLAASLDRRAYDRLQRAFGRLASGDRVVVTYFPGEGLTMRVNDRVVARARGHRAVDAILEEWKEGETVAGRLERLPSKHPCG